jgi:uncharacterized phage-like protein YoqJ
MHKNLILSDKTANFLREEKLKRICINIIKKDLELILLTHKIGFVLGEVNLISNYEDEFSSLDHAIYLAFLGKTEGLDQSEIDFLHELVWQVVFSEFDNKSFKHKSQEINATRLVFILFALSNSGTRNKKEFLLNQFIENFKSVDFSKYINEHKKEEGHHANEQNDYALFSSDIV